MGLFLGDISWVFYRAHEHSGRQCWDLLAEGYDSGNGTKVTCGITHKNQNHFIRPKLRALEIYL
jgi:hypothetical protein